MQLLRYIKFITLVPIPLTLLSIVIPNNFNLWNTPFFIWLDNYPGNFTYNIFTMLLSILGLISTLFSLRENFAKRIAHNVVIDIFLIFISIVNFIGFFPLLFQYTSK